MTSSSRFHPFSCVPSLIASMLLAVAILAPGAFAASPPAGTVSEADPLVTWEGPFLPPTGSASCAGANDPACDNFQLTIVPPAASFGPYVVKITVQPELAGDWDLQVYFGGSVIASSGNAPSQAELVSLSNPQAGVYTVAAAPFAPAIGPGGNSYSATAQLAKAESSGGGCGGEFIDYATFVPPAPLGLQGSAESNIGVCGIDPTGNPNHYNDVLHLGSLQTLRLSFDECSSPARGAWEDVSFAVTSTTTLDPILFTDRVTNRTITSQLAGKTSLMSLTDDCGDTYIGPTQGAGINSGVDHQTVGGGPYKLDAIPPPPPSTIYDHAVYYCSQDIVTAQCARSDDGGITFGPAVTAWNLTECGGLHGHVKVAPQVSPYNAGGVVYIPNGGCNGEQGVVVSDDNGLTWDVRPVPGAVPGPLDPSVALATDGTVYFGWSNGGVEPMVAVSHDEGQSWTNISDVANPCGVEINNTIFPAMVAGDPDRAAMAFYGAFAPGQAGTGSGDDASWPGNWYLYVAHTYDGGLTWSTVNATPGDPVQRNATICAGGFGGCDNGTRNLLDFMDANIDRYGRALVGYQDGCVGACASGGANSFTANSVVSRQVSGRRLFAEFDVLDVPDSPRATATYDTCDGPPSAVDLSWSSPDDHGSAILEFRIYRRTASTGFSLLATVPADTKSYTDSSINPSEAYFYQVTAVNGFGEGVACDELQPTCGGPGESPCKFPGITVLTDATGDWTAPDPTTTIPEYDIESLRINERSDLGAGKIEFVLKMASMANPPANSTWPILFTSSGDRFVRMHTDLLGEIFFTFGTGTNMNPTTAPGSPADPQSSVSDDGFIRIVVDRADIGNPALGSALTQFLVRIRREGVVASLTPDNMPDSLARAGAYTVFGSELCTDDCTPPLARDDGATTDENQPVVIHVVANDSDGGEPPLTVVSVSDPANGTTVNNFNGTVTYIPDTNFSSPPTDTFTYTVRNDCGLTSTATVSVQVNPFCALVPTGTFEDDFEPAAEPGWGVDTAANNLGPASPTWAVTPDAFAESPINSFFSDATTLDLKDDRLVSPEVNLSSSSQLIFWHRFEFESTFDGGVLEVSTDLGRTWVDVGAGNIVTGGYNGTIDSGFGSPIAGRPAWTGFSDFIDAMNQVVVDLGAFAGFDVRVRWRLAADPLAVGSLPGSGWWIDDVRFTNLLELEDCNRPPIARDDEKSTTLNNPVTLDVFADNGNGPDFDPDGDAIAVESFTQPANGTASFAGSSATYAPDSGFLGTDTFTYEVCDDGFPVQCSNATVTIFVEDAENQDPDARDDDVTTDEDTPVAIDVFADNGNGVDSDPDGDPITVSFVGQPANGSTVHTGGSSVTYTPNAGYFGPDSFTYTIRDGRGGSDSATVRVTVNEVPNRRPEARDDTAATEEDTPVTIPVLANDSDPDNDPLTVGGVSDPPNGSAVVNPDETVTYTPDNGFTGIDTFTYTACDPEPLCDEATVTVEVTEPPSIQGKVTGGGYIPGSGSDGKSNFGFNAKAKGLGAQGRITYDANNGGISLKGTVDRLEVSFDGTQATFRGPCELRTTGEACTYTVDVEDNGEPGTGVDFFGIRVLDSGGGLLHEAGDLLGGGNIQIH